MWMELAVLKRSAEKRIRAFGSWSSLSVKSQDSSFVEYELQCRFTTNCEQSRGGHWYFPELRNWRIGNRRFPCFKKRRKWIVSWSSHLNRIRRNPKIISTVRILGSGVTAVAVLLTLQQESKKIILGDWASNINIWLISIGIYSVTYWCQALSWSSLIGGLGRFKFGWKDFEIYAISNIANLTTGAVWYLLERVERCDQRGTKAQITLTASSIEWLLLVISGALVYLFISSNWIGLSSRIGVMQSFGGLFFCCTSLPGAENHKLSATRIPTLKESAPFPRAPRFCRRSLLTDCTVCWAVLSFSNLCELEFDQTANLRAEAGHERLLHNAGVDAEPIPELEFDQTMGR